jgi:ABC-2 type transport system permease protein
MRFDRFKLGFSVGSWSWLLHHELRLQWRALVWYWWLIPMTVTSFAFVLIMAVKRSSFRWEAPASAPVFEYVMIGLLIQFASMLSSAVGSGVGLLTSTGNIDLLLSSPIRSRTVFAVRAVGLALTLFASNAVVVAGIAILLAVFAGGHWLGLIPVLLALALLASGVGLLLTFGLIRWFGARRTLMFSQVISSTINALIFVIYQYGNYVLNGAGLWQTTAQVILPETSSVPFEVGAWWFAPVRAALGSLLDGAALLLVSGLVLYATIGLTHRWYWLGVQDLRILRRVQPHTRAVRFRSGSMLALVIRDWRLLSRDSVFISSTIMNLIYTLPAVVVLAGMGSGQVQSGHIPNLQRALPISAALLAGNLTNRIARAIVGHDTDSLLLELAPIGLGRVRMIKLLTALVPTVVLLSPVVLLGFWFPGTPVWTVLWVLIACGVSFGITGVWLLQRHFEGASSGVSETDVELLSQTLAAVLLVAWTGLTVWLTSSLRVWAWLGWGCLAVVILIPTVVLLLTERVWGQEKIPF